MLLLLIFMQLKWLAVHQPPVIPLCVQPLSVLASVKQIPSPPGILLLGPNTYISHPYIIVIQRTVH